MSLARVACLALAASAFACAGGVERTDRSSLERSVERASEGELPCVRTPEMQGYVRDLWNALQVAWVLPPTARAGHFVTVAIDFDGRGENRAPEVVDSSDPALQASVERAFRDARLPSPSDDLRACLAAQRITAKFSATPR